MKIGMNLLLWTDHPTADEHLPLIESIGEWGFDGVEFPIAPVSGKDIRRFQAKCDELGLGRTTILALDCREADPASADKRLRSAAVEQIKQAIDQTKELGAGLLSGPLFQGLGRFSGVAATAEEWKWSAETLRTAGEYAGSVDLKLALEPLNRFEMYIVNTMEQASRLISDIGLDNIGLLADTHHANIEENDTCEAWDRVFKHIFHIHISENNRGTPGKGQAISPQTFNTIAANDYQGWLTIEAFGQRVPGLISRLHLWRDLGDSDEALARSGLAFITEQLRMADMERSKRRCPQ